jgi:hypothetical protein
MTEVLTVFRFMQNLRTGRETFETTCLMRAPGMRASLQARRIERFILSARKGWRFPPRLMISLAIREKNCFLDLLL